MEIKKIDIPVYNGIYEYTQTGAALTGVGSNGKFKAVADGIYSSFTVNGVTCTVKNGDETSIELKAGNWYDFILDTEDNTVNFKQGGAGLNFKIVGGTTQPENPSENTIWVKTNTEIAGYEISETAPENPVTGLVWIYNNTAISNISLNVFKKEKINITPVVVYQYHNSEWTMREAKVFMNNEWTDIVYSLLDGVSNNDIWALTGFTRTDEGLNLYCSGGTYDTATGNAFSPQCDLTGIKTISTKIYRPRAGKRTNIKVSILSGNQEVTSVEKTWPENDNQYIIDETIDLDVSDYDGLFQVKIYLFLNYYYGRINAQITGVNLK